MEKLYLRGSGAGGRNKHTHAESFEPQPRHFMCVFCECTSARRGGTIPSQTPEFLLPKVARETHLRVFFHPKRERSNFADCLHSTRKRRFSWWLKKFYFLVYVRTTLLKFARYFYDRLSALFVSGFIAVRLFFKLATQIKVVTARTKKRLIEHQSYPTVHMQ
jgi:hypothetical protein